MGLARWLQPWTADIQVHLRNELGELAFRRIWLQAQEAQIDRWAPLAEAF